MKRLYPNRPILGASAVIICNGKILLEKRKNDPGRGKWSLPGGLVELGERLEETVIREVREETGLKVEKPEVIDVVDNITVDEKQRVKYHFVVVVHLAKIKGGKLKAETDAEELKWIPLEEVEKHDLTKSFREFFKGNKEKIEKLDSCPQGE